MSDLIKSGFRSNPHNVTTISQDGPWRDIVRFFILEIFSRRLNKKSSFRSMYKFSDHTSMRYTGCVMLHEIYIFSELERSFDKLLNRLGEIHMMQPNLYIL